ncbi:tetratricopeptide repeat protein [Urbifossiella limnaea]|uniref:Lipoprotein NlpI n=1 Tax=Urbifossiella limnaea TaxID=2528023 RepID=A0A517XXI6_9BACT|nr:tetratricopeptide repeat protein [Urbifossiella limnaea]QDU22237.1 lipoprotein NlpI [Urbifossiella limnaea]
MARDRTHDDAQDLFTRGHKAFAERQFAEAVECFSRAITLRPDVAAGYRYRAYAFLELGDRIRALNDLDQAVRLKPDDPQAYADRAAELFTQKAFDQAVADCDKVLSLDPGRAPIRALRGRCHAARGDTPSALADYAEAIEADAENAPRVLMWRAGLRFETEDYDAAEADCTAALLHRPDDADALHLRGAVRQQAGDGAGAEADFSAAITRDPQHGPARLGRAVCRFLQKDFAGVVADCDAAVRLLPNVARVFELRGSALRALGRPDEALQNFDEAIRLAPQAAMPFNYRAGAHYAKKDYATAARDHLEALKRDPRNAATFNQLGWVWATCPDPDVRNGPRAKECATRACELTEWAEAGYLDTLAAACAECGEFDEAVRWQEKAIAAVAGDAAKEADYETRLELYRRGKPARVEGGLGD